MRFSAKLSLSTNTDTEISLSLSTRRVAGMSTTTGAHILLYPFPTAGHIIPLLDLTHRLLIHSNLRITIAITPNNLPLLQPYSSSANLHHLLLPSPNTAAAATTSPSKRLSTILRSLRHLHYPALLSWFKSHPSPPVVVLSDFFLGWTQQLACQVGVPRVVFSPAGAFALSISYATWQDVPKNDNPENMEFVVSFSGIPNCPSYPWWQIVPLYREGNEGDPDWEIFRENYLSNLASYGVLLNSFADVEGVYIDHIKATHFGRDRVWAVGPILPSVGDDDAGTIDRGGSSSVSCHEVLTWLDSRKDGSVVYVCFGSRAVLTCKQMDELALGLERSGVHFVWCVRQPAKGEGLEDCGVLPDGFEDRVAQRGFVIKGWAPQMVILRHRAIGAFLTHCGWNSTIEGISAGVVMLTWPMGADQFTNAKLLVDQLGVGVRVGEATRMIPHSDELARVLRESIGETSPEKIRVKELREAALVAVNGGSSDTDLEEFVKWVSQLKNKSSGINSSSEEAS